MLIFIHQFDSRHSDSKIQIKQFIFVFFLKLFQL